MIENRKRLSFFKNTIMLYILTFSNYLMSLIIVPYETRILGTEKYGLIGVTTAVMVYFQLIIDFGFLLSATEEVSINREDKTKLSIIFSSVTINKLFLSIICVIVLIFICRFVPRLKENMLFFITYFIVTLTNSLIPDYLYRGIEKMEAITVRAVLIKFFFTVMVFVFVKSPKDYMLIPILQILGNIVALAGVYLHLYLHIGVKFTWCRLSDLSERFKRSVTFFFSRIASTAYTVANTIILDILSAGSMTAYYTSADKLVTTAKSGLSPISDSLYPYMTKNRDFRIVKKVLLMLEPLIILGCTILFIWARPLCIWFFGENYANTALALRSLIPVIVVILPSYIFGFPMLSAMGLSKYANYSVVFGSIVHIVNLCVLYFLGLINIVSLGIATSLAETLILLFRIVVVLKYKNRLNEE